MTWEALQYGIKKDFEEAARFSAEDAFTAYAVWAENLRERQRQYQLVYLQKQRLLRKRVFGRKLTETQVKEVVAALQAGATSVGLARKYPVSRTAIRRIAILYGVKLPMGRPRRDK